MVIEIGIHLPVVYIPGRGSTAAKQTGAKAALSAKAAAPGSDDEEGPSQKKKAAKPAAEKKAITKASAAKRPSLGTIKDHGEALGANSSRQTVKFLWGLGAQASP